MKSAERPESLREAIQVVVRFCRRSGASSQRTLILNERTFPAVPASCTYALSLFVSWCPTRQSKSGFHCSLAVPRTLVPERIALIHHPHVYSGIASALALAMEYLHWPTVLRDVRENVLSCECCRRKRRSRQLLTLLSARAVKPWEGLKVDLLRIGTTYLVGNK